MQKITINNLMPEMDKSTDELLAAIELFSQSQFNSIPFEGSWTAGQVCEHLLKAESGFPQLLKGNKRATDRPVDAKMEIVQSVFLDFTTRFQSPEFILPSDKTKDKAAILEGFKKIRKETKESTAGINMDETCTGFSFPQIGEFTGWEVICFLICHSRRHTRQLNNIYAALNK